MYYKLTMKDKRNVFVPVKELEEQLFGKQKAKNSKAYWCSTAKLRLAQIQIIYPDCIDWEMVEPEEVSRDPLSVRMDHKL